MNVQGKLFIKYDTQQVTDTFRKREFVLEYTENPMYPQYVKFQLIQEKCDLLENYEVGQEMEVSFNLRGRKWTSPQGEDKFFNSLDAWRLSPVTREEAVAAMPESPAAQGLVDVTSLDDADDLPF